MSRIHEAAQRAAEAKEVPAVPERPDRAVVDLRSYPTEQRESPRPVIAAPRPVTAREQAEAPKPTSEPRPASPAPRPVVPRPVPAAAAEAPPVQAATLGYYRRLVATLTQMKPDDKALTVLVTSAAAGEGKTTTAANVALTFARSYSRRVLLIDGDMRRPQLHQFFRVGNRGGLGACLSAGRLLPDAAVSIEPRLMLLTSGEPEADPVSYLSNPAFAQFMEEVSSQFDAVVFDSPPAGLLPDAELIAAVTQTSLLVIHAGRTPYDKVERAAESIGRERIAGVVLNRANAQSDPSGYYSDAYGYGAARTGTQD